MRFALLGLLFLTGCPSGDGGKETGDTSIFPDIDHDDDGSPATVDCDDDDPTVSPLADEIWYDGVDQDCSGGSDFDQDGDGLDREPEGADCDDTDPTVGGGGVEVCDGKDNDCDGAIDEDAVDQVVVYADLDGDGHGAGPALGLVCEPGEGESTLADDCDDTRAGVRPGATERCDGVDNDCDGTVDVGAVDGYAGHPDDDGDGYGDQTTTVYVCEFGGGLVVDGTDCDDGDALSNPGAAELCDLEDNDCDGAVDEDDPPDRTYFLDGDGDGYGADDATLAACGLPDGYAERGGDCDDGLATINPDAIEVCDDADNDCDGEIDSDAEEATAWHPDADGDGYGDAYTETRSCDPIDGWTLDASDCDDSTDLASPDGTEVCDGYDNDCDGLVDPDGSPGSVTLYADADGDGYGDGSVTLEGCDGRAGYVTNADDCDDASDAAYPGALEECDGLDNDCNGEIDEDSAFDAPYWYYDGDGDLYGDPSIRVRACSAPPGYVDNGDDCDDADAVINPDNAESDNLADDDCDELVDEDFLAVGDVVITEVARQPYTGGSGSSLNADAQWFEVVNASSRTVSLSGWRVREQTGDSFYVRPDLAPVLAPGDYAVFCYEDAYFADPSDCDYVWGDPSLGNPYFDDTFYFDRDDDLVSLFVAGVSFDEVHWTYDASDGYWPRTARYSMELDDAAIDVTLNDDEANWCVSGTEIWSSSAYTGYPDYGTPGAANGGC